MVRKTSNSLVLLLVVLFAMPMGLQAADKVLVLKDGAVASFGPRDEILKQFMKPAAAIMPKTKSGGAA